jgi:putative ABC transport system substrate-binding protein
VIGVTPGLRVPRQPFQPRRIGLAVVLAVGLSLTLVPLDVKGQHAGQAKVGLLFLGTAGIDSTERSGIAVREGLRQLGWVENQNIHFEHGYAGNFRDRLDQLVGEMVKGKVDVIVALGTEATRAARRATTKIPIVMAGVGDPVRAGFIASLSRPGGNTTGVSLLNQELWPKRLELIKEVVPAAARVAVVSTPDPQHAESLKLLRGAAPRFGLELQNVLVSGQSDLDRVFTDISKGRVDAILVQPSPDINEMGGRIAQLAEKQRLPSIFAWGQFVELDGLISYGADLYGLQRHAASYVDKILKGAKPADLPVEQPTKFEFVVNLKTAKQIGLTIPPNVLARADRVIR